MISKRGYVGSPRILLAVPYCLPWPGMERFIIYEIFHGRVALEQSECSLVDFDDNCAVRLHHGMGNNVPYLKIVEYLP